jgi:peptidoglycan/LPS O-acetylase OafA/YrhL
MVVGTSAHSQSLDAIRGVAISLVVGYHYWPSVVHSGDLGVDLFFVLSGYLIGGILLDNRSSDRFFSTFYIRRVFRIVPLYALLLAVGFATIDLPLWWFLIFGQNIGWIVGRTFPFGSPLSVTWSLAIEEQFYLLLPALIWLLPAKWLIRILWMSVIAAPVWRWTMFHVDIYATYLLLPCRLDTLMGGALVACFQRGHARSPILWLLLALIAPCLDSVLHSLDPTYNVEPLSKIALVFVATLFLIVQLPDVRSTVLRPLCWAGVGAYSIYLFHLPILALCGGNRILATAMVGAVAWVSWRFVERPLIGLARSRWQYSAAAPKGAGLRLALPVG